jgi:DeoR family transcriptional regulator of aga operon
MQDTEKMTTAKRRSIILRKLDEHFEVNVSELSKLFHVSEVTIRHDLSSLENKNLLVRARGGAIKANIINRDPKLAEKTQKNLKEKKLLAKLAVSLIKEGDTILIDSGSTTEEVAKLLTNYKSLTIVTNAINVVWQFTDNPNITVIVPGGILRHNSFSLVGMTFEQNLNEYYCDKLLLGVDAIDINGIYTPNIEEANLNRTMIKIAKELIVITDSSKFDKRSLTKIVDIEAINTIITDSGISSSLKKMFEEKGITVLIGKV